MGMNLPRRDTAGPMPVRAGSGTRAGQGAIARDSLLSPAHALLALTHIRLGRREAARKEWQLCRDHEPNNPQVRAYLALAEHDEAPTGD